MADFITYENDTFKCIDCIPDYSGYHSIYVARNPHADENGREYRVINTQWGREKYCTRFIQLFKIMGIYRLGYRQSATKHAAHMFTA